VRFMLKNDQFVTEIVHFMIFVNFVTYNLT
jgi:hypothetical protein